MQPVKSTAEILSFKALNRDVDKSWIDWAVDMILAGFDTENLIILAGESEPFNQFQMQKLTDKIIDELHLDYSDKEKTIKNYVYYLVSEALIGDIDISRVLGLLKDLCIELDYEDYLYDFYSLFFAKEGLSYSNNQWYWEGADKDNIDVIIWELFTKWKASYEENGSMLTEKCNDSLRAGPLPVDRRQAVKSRRIAQPAGGVKAGKLFAPFN